MKALMVRECGAKNGKPALRIVVGKRVSKKAVERNRIKRRIRAILLPWVKRTKKTYTVITEPAAQNLSFQELKEKITKQWQKFSTF